MEPELEDDVPLTRWGASALLLLGAALIAGALIVFAPSEGATAALSGPISGPVSPPVSEPFVGGDPVDDEGASPDGGDFVDPLAGSFDRSGFTGGGAGPGVAVGGLSPPVSPPVTGPRNVQVIVEHGPLEVEVLCTDGLGQEQVFRRLVDDDGYSFRVEPPGECRMYAMGADMIVAYEGTGSPAGCTPVGLGWRGCTFEVGPGPEGAHHIIFTAPADPTGVVVVNDSTDPHEVEIGCFIEETGGPAGEAWPSWVRETVELAPGASHQVVLGHARAWECDVRVPGVVDAVRGDLPCRVDDGVTSCRIAPEAGEVLTVELR